MYSDGIWTVSFVLLLSLSVSVRVLSFLLCTHSLLHVSNYPSVLPFCLIVSSLLNFNFYHTYFSNFRQNCNFFIQSQACGLWALLWCLSSSSLMASMLCVVFSCLRWKMTTWKNYFWTNTVNFSDCDFLCGVCVCWGGVEGIVWLSFPSFIWARLKKEKIKTIMIDQHQSLMSEVSERWIHTEAAHNKIWCFN